MKTSFEKKIAIVFVVLLLAITGIGYYTYTMSKAYQTANYWVQHTENVLYTSESSISIIKDFNLENASLFSDGVNEKKRNQVISDSLLNELNLLKVLTQDNAIQQKRLSELLILVNQRIAFINTFSQIKTDGTATKEKLTQYIANSHEVMAKISVLFNDFQNEEKRLLFLRESANTKIIARFYTTFYCLLASILTFFLLIGWMVRNSLLERRKNVEDLSKAKLFLESINNLTGIGSWEMDVAKDNCDLSSLSSKIYEIPYFQTLTIERIINFYKEGESRDKMAKAVAEAQLKQTAFDLQLQIITHNGNECWVEVKGVSEFAKGKCKRIYGTLQNIDERKKEENRIIENEALLQTIYDHVPILIGVAKIVDNEILHIKVNKALAQYIGRPEEEVENHFSSDIGTPQPLVDYWIGRFNEADKLGKPLQIEYQRSYEDKPPHYLSGVITCLHNVELGEKSFVYILNDITKFKTIQTQLSRSAAQFQGTFEYSGIGMAIVSLEGIWIDVNRQLCEIVGYTKEELLGNKFEEITYPDDIEVDWGYATELLEGKKASYQMEKRYIHKSGALVWALLTVSVLRDAEGNVVHFISQIEDVTRRKQVEKEVEQKNKDLAAANKELEQFAYVASHDLQEPLRTIAGFISLLEKKYNPLFDDSAKKYMQFIMDGAVRMRSIITDILEYSKLSKTEIEFSKVNIKTVVEEIAKAHSITNHPIKPTIEWGELPVITANRIAIQQLFTNLIGNAVKYQLAENKPIIQISALEKEDYWQFSVADNGIGIDPKFYEKVFIVFKRLHSNQEYSGIGIGLAICQRVVQKHNGNIWIENAPGGGTIFYFTLAKDFTNKI